MNNFEAAVQIEMQKVTKKTQFLSEAERRVYACWYHVPPRKVTVFYHPVARRQHYWRLAMVEAHFTGGKHPQICVGGGGFNFFPEDEFAEFVLGLPVDVSGGSRPDHQPGGRRGARLPSTLRNPS